MVASAIIGFDRGASGHAAGLRTMILVGLAAAVAMIQANLLLPVDGKTPQSFGVLDLMRLPLGILTGVGFIGGGAILRRGDIVSGVTTAATLWLTTVVGLCFGGGQIVLGISATALALFTLLFLKWLERGISRQHRARLVIRTSANTPPPLLAELTSALNCRAYFRQQQRDQDPQHVRFAYDLSWRKPEAEGPPLELLRAINERFQVISFEMTSEASH